MAAFDHERLEVYQLSIQFVRWVKPFIRGVDGDARRVEPVAGADRLHDTVGQEPPQPRHVVLERRQRVVRQVTGPERLDRGIGTDRSASVQREQCEQPPLQLPRRREVASGRVVHPHGPEHVHVEQRVGHPPILADADQTGTRDSPGESARGGSSRWTDGTNLNVAPPKCMAA